MHIGLLYWSHYYEVTISALYILSCMSHHQSCMWHEIIPISSTKTMCSMGDMWQTAAQGWSHSSLSHAGSQAMPIRQRAEYSRSCILNLLESVRLFTKTRTAPTYSSWFSQELDFFFWVLNQGKHQSRYFPESKCSACVKGQHFH